MSRVIPPREPTMLSHNTACGDCHAPFSQSWPSETEATYPEMVKKCHQTLRANGWRQALFAWYCPDCRKARAARRSQYLLYCGILLGITAIVLFVLEVL